MNWVIAIGIFILFVIVMIIPSPKINWKGFRTNEYDEDWYDRMNNL